MSTDVFVVAGARPNFVKVKPLLDALDQASIANSLVHTGQHYDWQMNQVFFEELGIRSPEYSLNVGSGSHARQTAAVMTAFEDLVAVSKPRAVVVVGDVNSTVACALVAAKAGVLVVHLEAGLRSRDWAMPEEINRVVTDRLSDLLLAPSEDAVSNLRAEGFRDDQVALVGNIMIDTLRANLIRARGRNVAESFGFKPGKYLLVTLHRPSNVDDPAHLERLLGALGELAVDLPVLFPMHPRTRARLSSPVPPKGVTIVDPLGYLDFLGLQADAAVVITDSGGVQEETTALGIPCITARDSTERPVTVTEGTNHVVGTDPTAIVEMTRRLLNHRPPARCPTLWDGRAAGRSVDAIAKLLSNTDWPRPTSLAQ